MASYFRTRQEVDLRAFEICIMTSYLEMTSVVTAEKFTSYFEIQPVGFSPGLLQLFVRGTMYVCFLTTQLL